MEIGLHDPGGEGHGTIHAHVHSIVLCDDGRGEPPKKIRKNRIRRQ